MTEPTEAERAAKIAQHIIDIEKQIGNILAECVPGDRFSDAAHAIHPHLRSIWRIANGLE